MKSIALASLLVLVVASPSVAAEPGPYDVLVQQTLLPLVHAPEVQAELKLTPAQVTELETLLRKVDAKWWPARILPTGEQREVTRELEREVIAWFEANTSAKQAERLRQIEHHAQAARTVLRGDVAEKLGMTDAQLEQFAELARATDEAKQALAGTTYGDPQIETLRAAAQKAVEAENAGVKKIVTPEQWQKLGKMVGERFDTAKLTRIYPLAPEFVGTPQWLNSSPVTMASLKGKVVLVHFYAFQCHNCHANFPIYQRWHQQLADKGVVVIGIQTPETAMERDPQAIATAAKDRDLQFPILLDLDSANWKAWGNTMWPCVYVVDKQGYLRLWWPGELNWQGATGDKKIEQVVEALLAEE
ncbi:redoxin domain-containing protein [Aeoliella sp. SH292]|uniref:redoxin domain-containing protein n=1 Tax=Aeoliella sp. SH292 TaxID=3454464 RepID=UPI003F9DF7D3